MSDLTARWRVCVEGAGTVKMLCEKLSVPFEIVPNQPAAEYYVAFPSAQVAATPREAFSLTEMEVERCNAALALARPQLSSINARGLVRERGPDGSVGTTVLMHPVSATLTISYDILSNEAASAPPRPTEARIYDLVSAEAEFAAALRLYGNAKNDYRLLFIVAEYMRDYANGGLRKKKAEWDALEHKGWVPPGELRRFTTTAHARHRHKPRPTPNEMPIDEANELIRAMLMRWLDEAMPS